MNWAQIAFGLSGLLSVILVMRLISLRLHDVYRVFCGFLLFETFSQIFIAFERYSALGHHMDYRITWLVMRMGYWLLSIWMVYALLRAILQRLPGILRLSKRVLNIAFPLALVIALLSAIPEYVASGTPEVLVRVDYFVSVALIFERLLSTIAVLTLLLMLAFVLWFPVRMPRNLAVFSIGFVVYFTAKTMLLLLYSFRSREMPELVDFGVTFILCMCLGCFITFLNRDGERSPVVMGHSWEANRQTQLLNDLEKLNAVLVRAGRR